MGGGESNIIRKHTEVTMSKETALDWLKQQLESYGGPQFCKVTWEDFDILIEQALQMEREQIEDAYVECWMNDGGNPFRKVKENAQQYYQKTYGGQDE